MDRRNFLRIGGVAALSAAFPKAARAETSVEDSATLPFIQPQSHFVFDLATGDPLGAKNENLQIYPASVTKLSVVALFYHLKKSGMLVADEKEWQAVESDIEHALIVSDNDAAHRIMLFLLKQPVFAGKISPQDIKKNPWKPYGNILINPFLQDNLDMKHTQFWNPNGLPGGRFNIPGHMTPTAHNVTTAADLAKLCAYILKEHPEILTVCGKLRVDTKSANPFNTNPLLQGSLHKDAVPYAGVDGLKTGYIRAARYNLVVTAKRDDQRIVVISMGNNTIKERNTNVTKLLNEGFAELGGVRALFQHLPSPVLQKLPLPIPGLLPGGL